MFNFLKSTFGPKSTNSDAEALVEEFARQNGQRWYFHDLQIFSAGVKFQNADPQTQRATVMAMLGWLERHPYKRQPQNIRLKIRRALMHLMNWVDRMLPFHPENTTWKMRSIFLLMLKNKLPFREQDVITIINLFRDGSQSRHLFYREVPQLIKILSEYFQSNPVSADLHAALERLIHSIKSHRMSVESQKWVFRLKELRGDTEMGLPLVAEDVWAETALNELQTLDATRRTAWEELLLHCSQATGSAPNNKWLNGTEKYLDTIGRQDFFNKLLHWFPLVDQPRISATERPHLLQDLSPVNTDILRGLVWLCSKTVDPQVTRALAALAISTYRRVHGIGPRAAKVGNACFWVLGNMPGDDGLAQLGILRIKLKNNLAQKVISRTIEAAAKRSGVSAQELEEMSIPDYGMEQVGLRWHDFEEVSFELRINGSEVKQVWMRKDAKRLASAPKAFKEKYPEELREISRTVKDIRKMLPAQRDRIENLFLLQKKWTLGSWQFRYLHHPLVGTIARRLIWKFSKGDKAASGIWSEGNLVDRDNKVLDWLDAATTVELWHPINADPGAVLEWRGWLLAHEIRQPFKQAYREVYLLTDAERNTRVYSNRYAAHILRQHQFNSLCMAKGWRNALRLLVDAELPPAVKVLPQWGLRAEYWIEGIGDQYGTDINATGSLLYLTTDQVRFYPIDAVENRAHAGGGGYSALRWQGMEDAEPLLLEEVPPLVFSEIMRDVDMFVGVASVGNDPNWLDGGTEVRYRDYWHSYSFGDLTESSKTRKQVLETLVPRLKIAARCKLTDKFLVVRGDIRTYKIHLGSGNILMEPNDQYLCIVPSRRTGEMGRDKLFVPFEGDQTLSIILSKAFLLAEDKKISDPSITRQIKR